MKKTAKFYHSSKSARDHKKAYDSQYQKKPSAVKKRVEANRANRKAGTYGNGDNRDYSHTIKGFESASKNRGRKEKSRLKGSKRN